MSRLFLAALGGALLASAPAIVAYAAIMDDKAFVTGVVSLNLEEIQLGQLAQTKSQNADVKAYGQKLVTDHTMNNNQATALATKIGATVPTQITADQKKAVDSLAALSGSDFDKMFIDAMVKGHAVAVQMFSDQSVSQNPDVAAFAKASLPTLQAHLAMAQMIQGQVGKPAA